MANLENLEVMECLAAFDPETFRIVAEATTNLTVVPVSERDPLKREALDEDVSAIAGALDNTVIHTDYEREVKSIAEQYGNHVV